MRIKVDEQAYYIDHEHPWPYFESYSPYGVHFTFLVPNTVSPDEIATYKVKLRGSRDVIGIKINRIPREKLKIMLDR